MTFSRIPVQRLSYTRAVAIGWNEPAVSDRRHLAPRARGAVDDAEPQRVVVDGHLAGAVASRDGGAGVEPLREVDLRLPARHRQGIAVLAVDAGPRRRTRCCPARRSPRRRWRRRSGRRVPFPNRLELLTRKPNTWLLVRELGLVGTRVVDGPVLHRADGGRSRTRRADDGRSSADGGGAAESQQVPTRGEPILHRSQTLLGVGELTPERSDSRRLHRAWRTSRGGRA